MYIIAHRGNINGPSPFENSPEHIDSALIEGYDVEIDIWAKDGELYLGHDEPIYKIDLFWFDKIIDSSWIHCKNIDAMFLMSTLYPRSNYFWHQSDDATLTSKGYFWTYPGKQITEKSILVLPENLNEFESNSLINDNPYGICTDYPSKYDKAD